MAELKRYKKWERYGKGAKNGNSTVFSPLGFVSISYIIIKILIKRNELHLYVNL